MKFETKIVAHIVLLEVKVMATNPSSGMRFPGLKMSVFSLRITETEVSWLRSYFLCMLLILNIW